MFLTLSSLVWASLQFSRCPKRSPAIDATEGLTVAWRSEAPRAAKLNAWVKAGLIFSA